MRFIRNVLVIVFITVAVTMASLWAITYWIKPNTFKVVAQKQLSQLTQQDSAIEGSVNWRIFPKPGLHITSVRIGNPKQTDAVYSLFVDNLLFNLQMMPLFRGQLVFDQLVLDGFTLRLNLDGTPPTHLTDHKKTAPNTKHASHPSRVALKSLLLINGQIILTHHTTEHATLSHVRLEALFPKSKHENTPIQLKANVTNDSAISPFRTALNYKGLIRLASSTEESETTFLDKLELDGQLALENLFFKNHEITSANTHLVFNHKKLLLNPLTLTLYNGESVGQLSYALDSKQLDFNQTGTTLNAEPIFHDFLGTTPPNLTGALDYSIHVSTDLNQPSSVKKAKINGSLTLRDGILTYVNIKELTQDATKKIRSLAAQNLTAIASENLAAIQGTLEQLKPWNINDYSGNTPYQLINLQYKTDAHGLLLYSLLLETKKLHLKGDGDLNLETNDVNARLSANLITHDPTILTIQQLLPHGFPLLLKGKLDNLTIHADRSTIRSIITNGLSLPKHFETPVKLIRHHLKQLQPQANHNTEDATSE